MYVVMVTLGALSVTGLVSFNVTRTDFRITGNATSAARAFYQADSGIQYVKNRLERDLANGNSLSALSANLDVQPPAGMQFDPVDSLAQLTDPDLYAFSVTGRNREARSTIEAVVRQALALDMGLFGDEVLYMYPNVNVFSYYSYQVSNPVPSDSVGGVKAGSNESLVIRPNTTLDGTFIIGENDFGITGTYSTSHPVEEIGRVDPDPLGAVGGPIAGRISAARSNNDNASVSLISGNQLNIKGKKTATFSAGTYYLTSLAVRSKGTLAVDTSAGPVVIYLEGGFQTWPNCDINVQGNPADFRVFSNSSQMIWLRPKNDIKAFVYAPFAEIRVWPNANFCGVIWGQSVDLHPNGDIYIDLSLLENIRSSRISIVSWKEIRN
jgi:hypothetical protein